MEERTLDAAATGKNKFSRSYYKKGDKIPRKHEERTEVLDFFYRNRKVFRQEFIKELRYEKMRWKKIYEFCRIVKKEWFDGKARNVIKKDEQVLQLMASVRDYLISIGMKTTNIPVLNDIPKEITPNFLSEEIKSIIEANKRLTIQYFPEWLRILSSTVDLGTDNIYCKRGIKPKEKKSLKHHGNHKEWAYVTSYTLSISVAEQFAKLGWGKNSIMLHTCYSNVADRILFFSPFIPGMNARQLEFGIIPSKIPLKYKFQDRLFGIDEYMVDNLVDISKA